MRPSPSLLRSALPLLAAAALLPGCADLMKILQGTGFQNPTLTYVRASVRDLALDQGTLDVVFRIDNPNTIGIDLARVRYEILIDGHSLVSGQPPAGLQIAAGGSSELAFPCTIRFAELAASLQAALTKKVVHWKASGEAGVNTPIGVVALPLSAEGDVTLPQLPKVSLQSPRIASLGLTSAKLVFPIQIDNPNDFALPLGGVSGAIKLAGTQVGAVEGGGRGTSAAAKGTSKVEVAVEVGLLTAGAAVAEAIAKGKADVGFEGSLDAGGQKLPVSLGQLLDLVK